MTVSLDPQPLTFDWLRIAALNEMSMCKHPEDRHWGAAWAYFMVCAEVFGDKKAVEISREIYKIADEKRIDPDPSVTAALQSVKDFQEDQILTPKMAEALDKASEQPPSNIKGRNLPSRKDK